MNLDSNKIQKERKYILIIGAILLLFGAVYRFFPEISFLSFLSSSSSIEEEINLKEQKLLKYQQIIKEKNLLEAQFASINTNLALLEARLLSGNTPSLGAVDMKNILNDIASKNGVEIKTLQDLKPPENEKDPYLTIPVQITFVSNIRQLKNIIYQIESSNKLLRINNLNIKLINQTELSQANQGSYISQISSSITIEGFMRK